MTTHSSSKYQKHIFVCINERGAESSRRSCGSCGGKELRLKLVEQIQKHGLKGKVRANQSKCLDACEFGPVITIYPKGLWYLNVKEEDVAEIFEASILNEAIVERLIASNQDWEELKKIRAAEKKI